MLCLRVFKAELVANSPVWLVLLRYGTPIKEMASFLLKNNSKLVTFSRQLLLRVSYDVNKEYAY